MTATETLSEIVESSLNQSMKVEDYFKMFENFAETGQSSGPDPSDALINYTKLNFQRSKRTAKTVELAPEVLDMMPKLQSMTWLLITETWCGDAANSVPVIAKMADASENIDMRIVLRDENLDLMDEFLTNGGRSIPKLIMLDADLNVIDTWGPRPKAAQTLYDEWKQSEPRSSYEDFNIKIQKWYMADKGLSIQSELMEKFEKLLIHL